MPTPPTGRLRVGVIGTGFGANVHIPAFKRSDDFEVVAVVSRHLAKAEKVARDAGVGWFSDDYAAMLREVDLDVVSIAVPGGLHHEMVLAVAAAGRHILCEKPFATSAAEGEQMLEAVRSAGVGHVINHEFRMLPARQAFRQQVLDGSLGSIFDVRALQSLGMLQDSQRPWSWWSDRNQYGGLMQALTSHTIDFFLWTFGPITSVSSLVDTFIRSRPAEDGIPRQVTSDDQNVSLLRFANGATGLLHVSGIYRTPRMLFEVQGSDASLTIEDNRLSLARAVGKSEPVELQPLSSAAQGGEGPVPLMVAYLSHAARAFRGEADDTVATFEQGLRVQAVMDAMHESSSLGGSRVHPSERGTSS